MPKPLPPSLLQSAMSKSVPLDVGQKLALA